MHYLRWTDRRVFIQAWQKCCIESCFGCAGVGDRIRKSRCGFIFRIFCRTAESGTDGKNIKEKEETQIEKEVAAVLEAEELLKEVPDILGCDMNYDTSGVELKAYLSDETSYIRIKEGLRAEILKDGPISLEDAVLLWLLRESGCIHDLFSVSEQNRVEERMTEAAVQGEKYRALWEAEFHNVFEGFMNRFVKTKSKLLKNPYLEGVNLVFPYLDRRKSVFIDMVIFGTNVADRRAAAVEYLKKKGFAVEEIRVGSETLLK